MKKRRRWAMSGKIYEFDAVVEAVPDKGGAFVRFPYDIRQEFGKGRVKAEITFDGEPYLGSIVNMGVKNEDGESCVSIKRCCNNRPRGGIAAAMPFEHPPKYRIVFYVTSLRLPPPARYILAS